MPLHSINRVNHPRILNHQLTHSLSDVDLSRVEADPADVEAAYDALFNAVLDQADTRNAV
ncbi:MAG: hypothetical protein PVI52_06240 [Chromatiales bacterium]|jgi:hypothetical protein